MIRRAVNVVRTLYTTERRYGYFGKSQKNPRKTGPERECEPVFVDLGPARIASCTAPFFWRGALSELRESIALSVPPEENLSARVPVLECRSRRYGLRTRKGGTGANLRLSVSGRCSAALYGASRQARTVGSRGAGRRGRAGERLGRGPDRRPYSCRIPCRPAEESGGGASGTFRTTDFPVSDYCALFSR